MRALLVAVLAVGCATADDLSLPGPATRDTGLSVREEVSVDTFIADDTGTTPVDEDTAVADTFVEDTAIADTFVPDTALGTVLVYEDYPEVPSRAHAAAATLGLSVIRAEYTTVLARMSEGGFNVIVVDAPNASLPPGLDAKLIDWMKGSGRLILSHWHLDMQPALTTELGVAITKYNTVKPIYRDTSAIDLFTGAPSPINGVGAMFTVHGFTLAVTAPSVLAARADSESGAGVIAVTHAGKVIVNGFLFADYTIGDSDTDGKLDVQELLENELAYVRSK
jgi:hypothetical protein